MSATKHWSLDFLQPGADGEHRRRRALIILNQPFSFELLERVWRACAWRCCADGGANRLYDALEDGARRSEFVPDLIKGDLDSLRPEVRQYYANLGVPIIKDPDQYATDLMKCISAIRDREQASLGDDKFTIILLGGLSGRLDQTVHTLSHLHKIRKERSQIFVVTEDNVAWVLDEGDHVISIDHDVLGPTCGLLPLGVDSATITTHGLQWNLQNQESAFSGMVSTSNAVIDKEVHVATSRPIWWCIELKGAR